MPRTRDKKATIDYILDVKKSLPYVIFYEHIDAQTPERLRGFHAWFSEINDEDRGRYLILVGIEEEYEDGGKDLSVTFYYTGWMQNKCVRLQSRGSSKNCEHRSDPIYRDWSYLYKYFDNCL